MLRHCSFLILKRSYPFRPFCSSRRQSLSKMLEELLQKHSTYQPQHSIRLISQCMADGLINPENMRELRPVVEGLVSKAHKLSFRYLLDVLYALRLYHPLYSRNVPTMVIINKILLHCRFVDPKEDHEKVFGLLHLLVAMKFPQMTVTRLITNLAAHEVMLQQMSAEDLVRVITIAVQQVSIDLKTTQSLMRALNNTKFSTVESYTLLYRLLKDLPNALKNKVKYTSSKRQAKGILTNYFDQEATPAPANRQANEEQQIVKTIIKEASDHFDLNKIKQIVLNEVEAIADQELKPTQLGLVAVFPELKGRIRAYLAKNYSKLKVSEVKVLCRAIEPSQAEEVLQQYLTKINVAFYERLQLMCQLSDLRRSHISANSIQRLLDEQTGINMVEFNILLEVLKRIPPSDVESLVKRISLLADQ